MIIVKSLYIFKLKKPHLRLLGTIFDLADIFSNVPFFSNILLPLKIWYRNKNVSYIRLYQLKKIMSGLSYSQNVITL